MISVDFYRPKCVDRRYLFRWRWASFFRYMAFSGYDLHFIIHISCLVFFEQKKYNNPNCGHHHRNKFIFHPFHQTPPGSADLTHPHGLSDCAVFFADGREETEHDRQRNRDGLRDVHAFHGSNEFGDGCILHHTISHGHRSEESGDQPGKDHENQVENAVSQLDERTFHEHRKSIQCEVQRGKADIPHEQQKYKRQDTAPESQPVFHTGKTAADHDHADHDDGIQGSTRVKRRPRTAFFEG